MKIIIYAIILVDTDKRDLLLSDLSFLISEVRKQKGCLRYDWASDSSNVQQINIFEEWEDKSAVEEHFAGANFSKISTKVGEFKAQGMSARKFSISKEDAVFNQNGKPSSTFEG